MFDSKQINAYTSIKAPEDLFLKISAAQKKKKRLNFKAIASIAACVLLLAAILPTYMGITSPTVNITPKEYTLARAMANTVTITIETHRDTQVSVSSGDIGIEADEKINGKAELIWNINTNEDSDPTLKLKDCFGTKEYSLHYNVKNDSWSIVKK